MVISGAALADAVAAGILLGVTRFMPPFAWFAAAGLHGTALLLLSTLRGAPGSRRRLAMAAALTVPVVGVAIAAVTLSTRGRGSARAWRRRRSRVRRAPSRAVLESLGSALSPCDALGPGDEERRRSALCRLSSRSDPEAIALLRWATAGRDPDLALSAALALDEIHERAERRIGWQSPAEARRVAD